VEIQLKEYYRTVRRVLIFILVLNIIVALAKVLYGWYSNSLSMLSDGFHSFFDGASNVVGIIGITLASRPADKEHKYGHWKIETFASIIIALFLFLVCFEVVQSAVTRFFNPSAPEITSISFFVMGITILINAGVSFYEYKKGREIDSNILIADSMHTRSDIYASIAVIFGFFAIIAGYIWVDPLIALLIGILIAKTGIGIIKESSEVLLDKSVIDDEVVEKIVKSVPDVIECHAIRTRGKKSQTYIDLHITVDPRYSIEEAHHIGDKVELKIKKSIPGVKEVLIHLEPETD
jgi:cation diffusion facilitator family transporter